MKNLAQAKQFFKETGINPESEYITGYCDNVDIGDYAKFDEQDGLWKRTRQEGKAKCCEKIGDNGLCVIEITYIGRKNEKV